jgi:uncharacterized protein (TIGR02246 family)
MSRSMKPHAAAGTNGRLWKTSRSLLAGWVMVSLSGCSQVVNQPVNEHLPRATNGRASSPVPGSHHRPHRPIPVIIQPPVPFRMAALERTSAQNSQKDAPDIIPVTAELPLARHPDAPGRLPATPDALPAVASAVRATFANYLAAFNRHDPVALAAHWTPDGENLDLDTGSRTTGRQAVADAFDQLFTTDQRAVIAFDIESVRPIDDDVAVVDGISQLSFTDREPARSRFSAVLVRHEDRWLIETVREAAAATLPTIHDRLAELAWLRGSWEDVSDGVTVSLQCDWNKAGTFLIRRHLVTDDPTPAGAAARLTAGVPALLPVDDTANQQPAKSLRRSITEYIGWDESRGEIRSWLFCSDGRIAEWSWLRTTTGWLLTDATHANPSGSLTQITLTPIGSDEMTLQLSAGPAHDFVPTADFLRTARPFPSQPHP